jgi:hypothetical protein
MLVAIVKLNSTALRMRKPLITWRLFRAALRAQSSDGVELWLERWWFSDEGVCLIDQQSSYTETGMSAIGGERGINIARDGKFQDAGHPGKDNPPVEPSRLLGTNPPIRGHSFREL